MILRGVKKTFNYNVFAKMLKNKNKNPQLFLCHCPFKGLSKIFKK